MSHTLIITPKTKVGELLDAYPQLEGLLIEMSPAFAKLKNPVLRKTVARVASLQQAALIGGLKVDELVNRLRKEAGQAEIDGTGETEDALTSAPVWFNESVITVRFDATPLINAGENPMGLIIEAFQVLKPGETGELKTPFLPAPILDKFRNRGFKVFSLKMGEGVVSYITAK